MSPGGRRRRPAARALVLSLVTLAACGRDQRITGVVLVDIDTLRADGLSAYGNPRATSPHLDAFARAGTRFDWAFSQAPYTLPSQASIVTSVYPWAHRVLRETDRLGPDAETIAERFRAAGWRTAAFVDGGFLKARYGFDQGFDEFVDLDGGGLARGEAPILEWLRARRSESFLLWIHTYDVHTPYAPPEPYRSRFAGLVAPPEPGFEPTSAVLEEIRASHWTDSPRRLEARNLAYSRAMYDGEVAYVDAWFGRLQAELERLDLDRRVVVAVFSDHGEEFQEHGSVLHEKLYSTVTRVPLLVRAPGGVAGQVVGAPVETVDIVPTLLEIAGLPVPPGLHGASLAGVVLRGEPPPARMAFGYSPHYGEQFAVADRRLRLIHTAAPARDELFRYRSDPLEATDLAAAETDASAGLRDALERRLAQTKGAAPLRESVPLDSETERSLRALGYLR